MFGDDTDKLIVSPRELQLLMADDAWCRRPTDSEETMEEIKYVFYTEEGKLNAAEAIERLWSLACECEKLVIDGAIESNKTRIFRWRPRRPLSNEQIAAAGRVSFGGKVYLQIGVSNESGEAFEEEPQVGERGFLQASPAGGADMPSVLSMWQLARGLAEAINRKILWLGRPAILVPVNDTDLGSPDRIFRIPARTCPMATGVPDTGFWCQAEPENPSDEDYINSTDPPAGIETFLVEAGLTLKEARQKIAEHRTRKSL